MKIKQRIGLEFTLFASSMWILPLAIYYILKLLNMLFLNEFIWLIYISLLFLTWLFLCFKMVKENKK